MKRMRVGIFDPYLDSLGGGERYVFSIASHLSKTNSVDVFWKDKSILQRAKVKFDLDLSRVRIAKNIFSSRYNLFQKFFKTQKYDVIFFVSDGSIPFLFGKKNILIFQFPVNWVNGKSWLTRLKLKNISSAIVYSDFVKKYIDVLFDLESVIVEPEVPIIDKKGFKKENIILNVGRFTNRLNAKKQEVMMRAFKYLVDKGLKNWRLIFIGSHLPSDREYLEHLKKLTGKYPIEIYTDIKFSELENCYSKAKIYWHATGYGEDLEMHPERAEHFGITTIEAMGGGAVPVVIDAGGQKEIVEEGKNGFLWKNFKELEEKTLNLIKNPKLMEKISKNSKKRALDFGKKAFSQKIDKLVS